MTDNKDYSSSLSYNKIWPHEKPFNMQLPGWKAYPSLINSDPFCSLKGLCNEESSTLGPKKEGGGVIPNTAIRKMWNNLGLRWLWSHHTRSDLGFLFKRNKNMASCCYCLFAIINWEGFQLIKRDLDSNKRLLGDSFGHLYHELMKVKLSCW